MCPKPFTSSPFMTCILRRYVLEGGAHVSTPSKSKGDKRKFAKHLGSSQSILRLSPLSAGGAISHLKRAWRVSLGAGELYLLPLARTAPGSAASWTPFCVCPKERTLFWRMKTQMGLFLCHLPALGPLIVRPEQRM